MRNLSNQYIKYTEQVKIADILGILLGALILAVGIQIVLVPVRLSTGGISGLAIILNILTGYDVWIWYVVLNIPIFIAGYRFVSGRFVFYSLVGTLGTSAFLAIISSMQINLSLDNLLLSSILGGVLSGVGIGLCLRYKGSSGGMDIVAVIVKRFWGYSLGETFFVSNIIVLALVLVTTNLELTLFSAISIFIASKVVDTVESGLSVSRSVTIVSDQAEEIAEQIMHSLHRGCTFLTGRGAYAGVARTILLVTVAKTQLPRLKELVFEVDEQAFMTINEAIEVYGQGFKSSDNEF